MPDTLRCALLILDYQVGAGDQPYAAEALQQTKAALEAGRKSGVTVIFSKIEFLPDYADIANSNKVFEAIKERKMLPPGESGIVPLLQPTAGEIVISKDRFSAFAGNALFQVLRAKQIGHLVLAGVTTSGVILATYVAAADMDFQLTVLADACADNDGALQDTLMKSLFPHSASVLTVDEWIAGL